MVKSSSSQSSDENKTPLKKGAWSAEEDRKLINYIKRYKIWNWTEMSKAAGLKRSGKSCRLRWVNYLRPDIKHGNFSKEEEETIMTLHESLGNRWSSIAAKLPGRTDNEVKNFWHTHLKKRLNPKASTSSSSEALKTESKPSKSLLFFGEDSSSNNNLDGLNSIIVESLTQPLSIDNNLDSTAQTNCDIGHHDGLENVANESDIVVHKSETFGETHQAQSLCNAEPIGNNGEANAAMDSEATFFDMGSSASEALWQQDSMSTFYDFYDGLSNDYFYWLDYMDL